MLAFPDDDRGRVGFLRPTKPDVMGSKAIAAVKAEDDGVGVGLTLHEISVELTVGFRQPNEDWRFRLTKVNLHLCFFCTLPIERPLRHKALRLTYRFPGEQPESSE